MSGGEQVLSECGIELMRLMAADEQKSWMLVHDDVCMGGLVMVLSNGNLSIVNSALQTLLKLAEWPNLRQSLKDFIGMKDQLLELMCGASPSVTEVAARIYNLLYTPSASHLDGQNAPINISFSDASLLRVIPLSVEMPNSALLKAERIFAVTPAVTIESPEAMQGAESRIDGGSKRRRKSFFINGANKAKTIVLQIRGLMDKDDIEVCRNQLITVSGVISITFDFRKKRVTVRAKPDLRPELLAKAVAQTMTMSADQVIKNEDGSEAMVPLYVPVNQMPIDEMPDYPSDVDSPVTGNQNVARRGAADSRPWSFLQSIGSFISNSFYW